MSDRRPQISVIIPLYNHEKFIRDAVSSVLNQSFADFELIVVDDGSTDNSAEVVKQIADARIKYFHQENRGAHEALNRGISIAAGKYISILNSDDQYDANRLLEMAHVLDGDASIAAVCSHVELIDEDGNSLGFKRGAADNWLAHDPDTSFKQEGNSLLDLLAGNFFHTTSNLFCRKDVFDSVGYFANLRYVHDYDFFLRLCGNFKIHTIDKPLLKYRYHSANTLSEDFAASMFETGLVLASFLCEYDLKRVIEKSESPDVLMAKLFNSLKTYDTERLIMTVLIYWSQFDGARTFFGELVREPENPFRKACIERFRNSRDISVLRENLEWQKGQTALWWQKASELENAHAWQKEQTDAWWKKAQELEGALAARDAEWRKRTEEIEASLRWQKEQTDAWWKKAQELEGALAARDAEWRKRTEEIEASLRWQKEQTDAWWKKACELESALQWQKDQTDLWWNKVIELESSLTKKDNALALLTQKELQLKEILGSKRWRLMNRLLKFRSALKNS